MKRRCYSSLRQCNVMLQELPSHGGGVCVRVGGMEISTESPWWFKWEGSPTLFSNSPAYLPRAAAVPKLYN